MSARKAVPCRALVGIQIPRIGRYVGSFFRCHLHFSAIVSDASDSLTITSNMPAMKELKDSKRKELIYSEFIPSVVFDGQQIAADVGKRIF
jgi:hypothetical protein